GKRKIADKIESIPALNHSRMHFDQKILVKVVSVRKEILHACVAIAIAMVDKEPNRPIVLDVGDGPFLVIKRTPSDLKLAFFKIGQKIEILLNTVVEHLPFAPGVSEGN